jgi:hypothetical protein
MYHTVLQGLRAVVAVRDAAGGRAVPSRGTGNVLDPLVGIDRHCTAAAAAHTRLHAVAPRAWPQQCSCPNGGCCLRLPLRRAGPEPRR